MAQVSCVAVLHPSPLQRAALVALLLAIGLDGVEDVSDLSNLLDDADTPRPELMLIALPPTAAEIAPLLEEILAWAPGTRVVFLASALDPEALVACFDAGACGYLVETISRDGLKHSLQLVGAGETVFPSELAMILSASNCRTGASQAIHDLQRARATPREIDVLQRLARGETNRTIAAALGISQVGLRAVIQRIRRKLRLSSRIQAAIWAATRGLGVVGDQS